MHCVEYYLKRPLKSTEIQLILYLYHDLKFSAELIMYYMITVLIRVKVPLILRL